MLLSCRNKSTDLPFRSAGWFLHGSKIGLQWFNSMTGCFATVFCLVSFVRNFYNQFCKHFVIFNENRRPSESFHYERVRRLLVSLEYSATVFSWAVKKATSRYFEKWLFLKLRKITWKLCQCIFLLNVKLNCRLQLFPRQTSKQVHIWKSYKSLDNSWKYCNSYIA